MEALSSALPILLILVLLSISLVSAYDQIDLSKFSRCLTTHSDSSVPIADAIFTQRDVSFQHFYQLRANNLRTLAAAVNSKPVAIITAKHPSHVQAAVVCAKRHGLQLRIRSGGHDYEGLSYTSNVPFVILDMFNLNSIDIDMGTETAWVQAGATTGELYYRIAKKSKVHGFPAGVCTTLGIGGHFSGGGYGFLMRKYGLTIDNVIDALLIDANGIIRDRKSMGEDVFWAIRGGGTTSFGIILSWRINLVRVPPKVTVFTVQRTLEQGATELAYRWQQVAPKLPKNLFLRLQAVPINNGGNNKTISVSFFAHFLGKTDKLIRLMNKKFPELGLSRDDCLEMSWVKSILYWAGFPNGTSIDDALLTRVQMSRVYYKTKSDYYKAVIPRKGLETLWARMIDIEAVSVQLNPYGGRMEEISDKETAFAHRAGNLFKVQYTVHWKESDGGIYEADRYVELSRMLYRAMTPYASSKPREAFINYRDLDVGTNKNSTDFEVTKVYGAKYFKNNFKRLAAVKAKIDPGNFFKNEQSIPPLPTLPLH
ncbi:hypothetical protein V6N12_068815 [Hibiscus sabdariffa]|uniref:FAD-binding PCMH-type domain-containing protein n=1 Tax=Hibiscus sabdariffa TaxID=183260 RepID=A0ABR2B0X8_9ROSI